MTSEDKELLRLIDICGTYVLTEDKELFRMIAESDLK
jgi:hypothetical protein